MSLVPVNLNETTKILSYDENNGDEVYDIHTFYNYEKIDGCTLTCHYGTKCGPSTKLTDEFIIPSNETSISSPHTIESPI